jgi:hypothetical protein
VGAIPGTYRIAVIPLEEVTPLEEAQWCLYLRYFPRENVIPKKYYSAETSGLEATVTEDGPNGFNFELERAN